MEAQSQNTNLISSGYSLEALPVNRVDYLLNLFTKEDMINVFEKIRDIQNLFQQTNLAELLTRLTATAGKKSFLVLKDTKYVNVPTENIAFFYVKYESPVIMCFNKEEYFVNYSLKQIQELLPEKLFYRLNRQYLINFNAIKEVEHYFAYKLLVNTVIPTKEKLLVSKEKVSEFLHWLDNR